MLKRSQTRSHSLALGLGSTDDDIDDDDVDCVRVGDALLLLLLLLLLLVLLTTVVLHFASCDRIERGLGNGDGGDSDASFDAAIVVSNDVSLAPCIDCCSLIGDDLGDADAPVLSIVLWRNSERRASFSSVSRLLFMAFVYSCWSLTLASRRLCRIVWSCTSSWWSFFSSLMMCAFSSGRRHNGRVEA